MNRLPVTPAPRLGILQETESRSSSVLGRPNLRATQSARKVLEECGRFSNDPLHETGLVSSSHLQHKKVHFVCGAAAHRLRIFLDVARPK